MKNIWIQIRVVQGKRMKVEGAYYRYVAET